MRNRFLLEYFILACCLWRGWMFSRSDSTQQSSSRETVELSQEVLEEIAEPSSFPTEIPSSILSNSPIELPSSLPSNSPSTGQIPPSVPPSHPSLPFSSLNPVVLPSSFPSGRPSSTRTDFPSSFPSASPHFPSLSPIELPSSLPSNSPSTVQFPTNVPSLHPTSPSSSLNPVVLPSSFPSGRPSSSRIDLPSCFPSASPTSIRSSFPTSAPSSLPSLAPSSNPSTFPLSFPSSSPSSVPSSNPSAFPSSFPSNLPSSRPSSVPSTLPSSFPSARPSSSPTSRPTIHPSAVPSTAPTLTGSLGKDWWYLLSCEVMIAVRSENVKKVDNGDKTTASLEEAFSSIFMRTAVGLEVIKGAKSNHTTRFSKLQRRRVLSLKTHPEAPRLQQIISYYPYSVYIWYSTMDTAHQGQDQLFQLQRNSNNLTTSLILPYPYEALSLSAIDLEMTKDIPPSSSTVIQNKYWVILGVVLIVFSFSGIYCLYRRSMKNEEDDSTILDCCSTRSANNICVHYWRDCELCCSDYLRQICPSYFENEEDEDYDRDQISPLFLRRPGLINGSSASSHAYSSSSSHYYYSSVPTPHRSTSSGSSSGAGGGQSSSPRRSHFSHYLLDSDDEEEVEGKQKNDGENGNAASLPLRELELIEKSGFKK